MGGEAPRLCRVESCCACACVRPSSAAAEAKAVSVSEFNPNVGVLGVARTVTPDKDTKILALILPKSSVDTHLRVESNSNEV